MALPAFAAERPPGRRCRSISLPARRLAANPPHATAAVDNNAIMCAAAGGDAGCLCRYRSNLLICS